GNIIGVCSRCLEDAIIPIDTDFTIIFLPSSQQRKYTEDEEIELFSNELDFEYYKGNKIDVDYLFRESLLLAIPYSPLCSESCKGLCQVCGGNLNRNECTCKKGKSVFNNIKLNLF
ncbi:MAG: YceD family protein, partial [Myxococcota bacterium]